MNAGFEMVVSSVQNRRIKCAIYVNESARQDVWCQGTLIDVHTDGVASPLAGRGHVSLTRSTIVVEQDVGAALDLLRPEATRQLSIHEVIRIVHADFDPPVCRESA